MLTVKQMLSTGVQIVFEASRVNYVPGSAAQKTDEVLFTESPDGTSSHTFLSGVYYIMNDAGNTVAKYDLGPEPKFTADA